MKILMTTGMLLLSSLPAMANMAVCDLKQEVKGASYFMVNSSNDAIVFYDRFGHDQARFKMRGDSVRFELLNNEQIESILTLSRPFPHTPSDSTANGHLDLQDGGQLISFHCYSYPNTGGHP